MRRTASVEQELLRARLIVILRLHDHSNVVKIATTLCDAGVQFLEVTLERSEGLRSLQQVANAIDDRAFVGAGTVMSAADVERASKAGARFIVAPDTNLEVIRTAREHGLLVIPGALTPNEIARAVTEGAEIVKLFPASLGGVDYLRALRAPFPEVKFIPTGGVTSDNAPSWLGGGAVAVAMGSNLVHATGDTDGLIERARLAVAATSSEG